MSCKNREFIGIRPMKTDRNLSIPVPGAYRYSGGNRAAERFSFPAVPYPDSIYYKIAKTAGMHRRSGCFCFVFNYSGWITIPGLGSLVSSSITCINLIVDPSPSSTQLIGSFQSSM